jgi:hypothetical protein
MGMQFKFEGNLYLASMTASELYGDGRAGSTGYNIPIKLPDGRFIRVSGWMESYPPQADGFVVINGDELERYATAELIDN